jgi:hypothetical protein
LWTLYWTSVFHYKARNFLTSRVTISFSRITMLMELISRNIRRANSTASNFKIVTSFRPALGPTQPPTQWVPGALSLGVKRPRRETDHSHPSCAEVKNAWCYTSTPPIRLHGVVLS